MIDEFLVAGYGVSMAPGILRDGFDPELARFVEHTPLWADHYTEAPLDDYPHEDTEWRPLTFAELVEQRNEEVWANILSWRDEQAGRRARRRVQCPSDLPLDYQGARLPATRSGEHGARFLENVMRTNRDQGTVIAALRNYDTLPEAQAEGIATGIERSGPWAPGYGTWKTAAFTRLARLDPDLAGRTATSELERLAPLLAMTVDVPQRERDAYEAAFDTVSYALTIAQHVSITRKIGTLRTLEAKTDGWVSEAFGHHAKRFETELSDWLHGNASQRQRAALLKTVEKAMHDPEVIETGQYRWIPIAEGARDSISGERGLHAIARYDVPFGDERDLIWELMRDHIGREKMPKEDPRRKTWVGSKEIKRIMPYIWEKKRAQRDLNPRPNG